MDPFAFIQVFSVWGLFIAGFAVTAPLSNRAIRIFIAANVLGMLAAIVLTLIAPL